MDNIVPSHNLKPSFPSKGFLTFTGFSIIIIVMLVAVITFYEYILVPDNLSNSGTSVSQVTETIQKEIPKEVTPPEDAITIGANLEEYSVSINPESVILEDFSEGEKEITVFKTNLSIDFIFEYYKNFLEENGWTLSEELDILGKVMVYYKNETEVNLLFLTDTITGETLYTINYSKKTI